MSGLLAQHHWRPAIQFSQWRSDTLIWLIYEPRLNLFSDICAFDNTGLFPVVCVYGPIYKFFNKLGNNKSPFGRPLTDVINLADGSQCCQFEGGHIHAWGEKADV